MSQYDEYDDYLGDGGSGSLYDLPTDYKYSDMYKQLLPGANLNPSMTGGNPRVVSLPMEGPTFSPRLPPDYTGLGGPTLSPRGGMTPNETGGGGGGSLTPQSLFGGTPTQPGVTGGGSLTGGLTSGLTGTPSSSVTNNSSTTNITGLAPSNFDPKPPNYANWDFNPIKIDSPQREAPQMKRESDMPDYTSMGKPPAVDRSVDVPASATPKPTPAGPPDTTAAKKAPIWSQILGTVNPQMARRVGSYKSIYEQIRDRNKQNQGVY